MEESYKWNVSSNFEIFDNMFEGVSVYKLIFNDEDEVIDGILEYMNPAAVKTMDMDPKGTIGKSALELFGSDFIQPHLKAINELHLTGQKNRFEVYYAPTNKYFLVSGFDMRDDFFVVLRVDVTEQRIAEEHLRESQELYKAIFENSQDAVFLTVPDGSILDANPAAEKMFGYSKEEIHKLGRDGIIDNTDPRLSRMLEERKHTGKLKGELKYIRSDGSKFDGEFSSRIFKDRNGNERTVIIVRDISKRKKAVQKLKNVNEKLNQERIRLQTIIENMPVGLFIGDENGKGLFVNEMFYRIWGTNAPLMSSVNEYKILKGWFAETGKLLKTEEWPGSQALKGKKSSYAIDIKRFDGKKATVIASGVPITGTEGNIIGNLVVFQDITGRRKMENELKEARENLEEQVKERTQELQEAYESVKESEIKFRELFNKALDMITLSESQENGSLGNFVEVNDAAVKILGYTREEFLNKTPLDLFAPDNHEEVPKIMAELQKGYTTFESVSITKGGRQIPVEVSVHIFDLGKKRVGLAIARDITERKKSETELKDIINELKRSNEELQSFAYITSHDLQEPLRTIASFAQLIERRYKGKLDPDADEFIEFMVDGASRMKEMILGLLDYSRVGTRGHEFTEFEAKTALNYALSNLGSAIGEVNAEITSDPLPVIFADMDQIIRVFQNLIGNALKFRRDGVQPKIHISVQKKGNEYIFSVSDNGIGLEEQYSDKIFEVFKRLHAMDEYQGAGIGLAIVKRIIDRHEGRIWVESKLGKGSTFYFTLPES
ncbi:PAS domain S-box protein [Methanobacterium sp.]|uniref:PAS domain-containing sensor histidine kinase n=1 Tax=Methanobacterium sp. TaxID=2164 RepID=UPI003C70AEED